MKKLIIIIFSLLLFPALTLHADQYAIDPDHSEIGFAVKHMVITNVKGAFREYNAGFEVDRDNKLVSLNADIVVASIDTRIQKRDDHLRSADFFEITKYPKITFVTTSVVPGTGNSYKVKGLLTIKNTVREIALDGELTGPVNDPWGNQRIGIVLRGQIDRRNFNVTYNKILETGGLLIDNEVKIHLEGEGILKK
jgi:polyisoprenoid-binding protein YceI